MPAFVATVLSTTTTASKVAPSRVKPGTSTDRTGDLGCAQRQPAARRRRSPARSARRPARPARRRPGSPSRPSPRPPGARRSAAAGRRPAGSPTPRFVAVPSIGSSAVSGPVGHGLPPEPDHRDVVVWPGLGQRALKPLVGGRSDRAAHALRAVHHQRDGQVLVRVPERRAGQRDDQQARITVRSTIAVPRRHAAARRSQAPASSRTNGTRISAASQYGCSNENLTGSPSLAHPRRPNRHHSKTSSSSAPPTRNGQISSGVTICVVAGLRRHRDGLARARRDRRLGVVGHVDREDARLAGADTRSRG